MANIIFSFDLRPQPKRIIVQDNLDYGALGWDINDVVAIVTLTGPSTIVYDNTDFNAPDIVPATSLLLNKVISLPLDPQTDYENLLKGNYTLKVSWYNSVLDATEIFLDTYQYNIDLPTIENDTVSGPYSGTLTSTDTTDYGSNVFLLTREHRIKYPTQLPGPPADIVSSDETVVVTPIYTNQWTIEITSEVEYHNPDELIILWSGSGEFFECVYGGCISAMYDAIKTMLDGYYEGLANRIYTQETYQKRLVVLNTAWHLLNIAYQEGNVAEADAQSYIIQKQVEYTGSGTCGGATSSLVVACPPYDGGGIPGDIDSYIFENGITKTVESLIPKIRLGGTLIQETVLTASEFKYGVTGASSGRTVTQTADTVNGVINKASDGTTESRVYVTAEKITLELANIATPANTRGYELLSTGLVEKADYTAGYVARSLISKSYFDANNNWGDQVGVTDATLTGDGTVGNPFIVANPFPGFTTLFADYGYVEPTHSFAQITGKPTTISGYGITDAYTKAELQTSGGASVHWDNITDVPTVTGYVPITGGEFTGVVKFSTANARSIISKKVGSGGTPSIPQSGENYLSFQDGDGDEQGYVGIDASGNIVLKTNVSGGKVYSNGNFDVNGNITVSGTVDGRDVAADGTAQDSHIADTTIHFTEASIDHTNIQNIGTYTHAQLDDHLVLVNNPHGTTLELARAAGNQYSGNVDYNNNSIVDINGIGFKDGQSITWNADDNTINIPTGFGPSLQAGQELLIKVYNNTASIIYNRTAVYPNGIFNDHPTIGLAQSDTSETTSVDYGMTTMDIPPNSYGFVNWFGKIRNVDTSMFNVGDSLWVSPTVAGGLVNVKPAFPNYILQAGIVFVKDAVDGVIWVTGTKDKAINTIQNFWNGTFRESFDFTITSNGTIITGSLSPSNGHPDMTMMFSDGFSLLTTTPAATLQLVPGTDSNPQFNYIYIPKSTKTLTVSTSDWPTSEEHIKVASVVLRGAATTQTDGALRNQNWNDHIEDTTTFQGHLSHITERIRQDNSIWFTGCEATITIDSGGTPDNVYVAVTSGVVYQMHRQSFPAINMQTGGDIHVVNHATTPYLTISNLNSEINDALGVTLKNSSFSIVIWGIVNKGGQASHLMCNLPIGKYGKSAPDEAVSDPNNYSVYDIPNNFKGVGFLIARATFTLDAAGAVWTLYNLEDLRGKMPNITAGGGGGGGTGVSTFLALSDTPSTYVGSEERFVKVNAAGTALEFIEVPAYTLPLAADGTRGGIQIGFATSNASIPVQLSSEKAYVTLTSAAINFVKHGITSHSATAWRMFYSNATATEVQELALGASGTVLKSNGAAAAPTWVVASTILDAYAALTSNSNATWDTSGGLNKTWSINASYTLTLTNFANGMSGDVKVTVTTGTPTITLAATGVTFKGNGTLAALAVGIYHIAWVCTSATTIEWNIAFYNT